MARRDDAPRVFDVSKPQRQSPSATSRPLIVGHRPMMSDPMVREGMLSHLHGPPKVTSVPVITDEEAPALAPTDVPGSTPPAEPGPVPDFSAIDNPKPTFPTEGPANTLGPPIPADHKTAVPPLGHQPLPPPSSSTRSAEAHPEAGLDQTHLAGSLAMSHPPATDLSGYWRQPLVWLALIVLILIGYGIADSQTDIPLPLHLFR
jgi:hypothetical protein